MDIKTEKDLNNLIKNKINEDTNLDYKIPDFSKKDFNQELAKDVSAMANSDGGTIIYGIKEENHFPTEIIWIKNDEGYTEKIGEIINSKIFRKIDGINIKKVLSEDKTKFVIIIDIPKSDIAPHQVHWDSKQRKYYRRYGSITGQMEYYEIEDLFFKRKKPVLEISLSPHKSENPTYNIKISNKGKVIAKNVLIKLSIPKEFRINGENWTEMEEKENEEYSIWHYFDNVRPVYPELPRLIGRLYHPDRKKVINKLEIGFFIISEDSELKVGKLVFEYISGKGPKFETEYFKDKSLLPHSSVMYS